jgi:molybdopterin synthase sulfur carrier subunit
MVTVEFLGPIAKEALNVEAENLNELKVILAKDDVVAPWLKDCSVAINDELVNSLEVQLKSGDKVSILPPVCGG